MFELASRTILVTGAAGGIGGEIVRRLTARGAEVIASDRTEQSLAAICAETGARALAMDLTSEQSVESALGGVELWGLVNCAGFGGRVEPLTVADAEMFDLVVDINTRGAFLVTKHASRAMVALGRGGAIVNVSSQAAIVALEGHLSYAASKAGLDAMTRVAALELGPHGIRVNSVAPTVVMTEMSASYWGRPEIEGPTLARMPLGRWATERDIAEPVVFLLSDAAAMITGVTLPVDGGYSIS